MFVIRDDELGVQQNRKLWYDALTAWLNVYTLRSSLILLIGCKKFVAE